MSPEQVKRASAIDESADIWSLGVVMYECLTGVLPWGDVESVGELIAAILTAPVPSVQDQAPWLEADLARVVELALSRDHASRLGSATELRDLLLRLTPSDTRVYLHELRAPSEAERSRIAPRFVHDDTLPLGDSGSGIPVVASKPPRRVSRYGVIAGAGVGAIAAALAWTMRVVPSSLPAPPPIAPSESGASPAVPQPNPLPPSPPPSQVLPLEIEPPGATVSVDGEEVPVVAGKATVEGAVGAVRRIRLSYRGQSREQVVRVTAQGLEPRRIALPIKRRPPPPASVSVATPFVPAAPPTGAGGGTNGLTPVFQ